MKTLLLTAIVISNLLTITPAFAVLGNSSGGGGDEVEERVNSIREDILQWIEDGGSNGLRLPVDITLAEYNENMPNFLENKKVLISAVIDDSSPDEELRVVVNGVPKTCRGFISKKDSRPHILCNISRFNSTSESGQYRLIHHEYAGLARVEKNEGAASDYVISSQITDYLTEQKVLRLAVNPVQDSCSFSNKNLNDETRRIVKDKGYNIVNSDSGKNLLTVKIAQEDEYREYTRVQNFQAKITEILSGIEYEKVNPIKKSIKCARDADQDMPFTLFLKRCSGVDNERDSIFNELIKKALKSLPKCEQPK